jgi:hypothetical protein
MLNEDLLLRSENALARIDAGLADLAEVIHLLHVPSVTEGRLLHVFLDAQSQEGLGMFGPAAASAV